MAVQIQFRRDTAAAWTAANPVLAAGELGLETDTTYYKIGNGSTAWTSLAYGSILGAISNNTITSAMIVDGTIVAGDIASDAITTAKILDANVTAAKLATDAVTTVKIQDLAVTGVKQANFAVSTKTTNYTLVAADRNTRVVMNAAGATTITVNTSLFSAGDTLQLQNIGAGVTTVTAGTATVSSAGPLAIPQYGGGTLYFTSAGVAIFFPSAGPAPTSGLTLISKTSPSAATQLNITNVFSSSYASYKYIISGIDLSANNAMGFRFGSGGTPDTSANYTFVENTVNNGTAGANNATDNTSFADPIYVYGSDTGYFEGTIMNPNLASRTFMSGLWLGAIPDKYGGNFNGWVNNSTQYTDLVLLSSATITATIAIYGYSN